MAFSFLGFNKKQQKNTQSHQYAIKDLQDFFRSLPDSDSYVMRSYRKEWIKKELPISWIKHIINHMMVSVFGNVIDHADYLNCKNVKYGNRLISEKYAGNLNQNIEGYFNTFGKEKMDELLLDIKSIFDDNIFASICAKGTWSFPELYLYETCAKAGITDLNNSFAKQKVIAVARGILSELGVPSQYHDLYVSAEQLADIFNRGKQKYCELQATAEKARRTPRRGNLSESQKRLVNLSNNLQARFGIEKRIYAIEDIIKTIDQKIKDYEEGQKAIRELGVILNSSVRQERKRDWAFLGGLAKGIAGTGAGIAVAANAIAENAEIERRNQQARQAVNQTIQRLYGNASSLSSEITELKNEKTLMQYHLKEARGKVVLEDYTTDQIFNNLEISSAIKKLTNGEGLEVTVFLKNCVKADVPSNVHVAVDGTLLGKIFFEDTYLETVVIPLPLFGVSDRESVTMYTDYYVEVDGSYSVEITPNKLWIVEV